MARLIKADQAFQANSEFIAFEVDPGQYLTGIVADLVVPVSYSASETYLPGISFAIDRDGELNAFYYDVNMKVVNDEKYFRFHPVEFRDFKVYIKNNDVTNTISFRNSDIQVGDTLYIIDDNDNVTEWDFDVAVTDFTPHRSGIDKGDSVVIDGSVFIKVNMFEEFPEVGYYLRNSATNEDIAFVPYSKTLSPSYVHINNVELTETITESGHTGYSIPDSVTVPIATGNMSQQLNSAFDVVYVSDSNGGVVVPSIDTVKAGDSLTYYSDGSFWPADWGNNYPKSSVLDIEVDDNEVNVTLEMSVSGNYWEDQNIDSTGRFGKVQVPRFVFMKFSQDVYVTNA